MGLYVRKEKDMVKSVRERVISLVIALVLVIVAIPVTAPAREASAASKYIKVDAFIKYLVTEMKLPLDNNSNIPYIDAAMKAGMLKEGDFKDYSVYLTRTDCAVLANRADEYIYGAHYGFTDGIYEFLKDCTFVNGFLYYNIKGDLYPEVTDIWSYPVTRFMDEVVLPRLEPHFKFPDGLIASYYKESSLLENPQTFIEIGKIKKTQAGNEYEPFITDDFLIQAWQKIIDGDRRVQAVYDLRISDLNKITKSKRQDVVEIVAKGIIKGYSNGMYVQNRSFKGSNKITASGAKGVVALVLDPYSRAPISPDGQLIRTTNLPKNYTKYPYILECFPNEFYEVPFYFQFLSRFKNGTMPKKEYRYPVETGNLELLERYDDHIFPSMRPYMYYDTIMNKANVFLQKVFNVDYRTVDQDWIDDLANSYAPYGGFNAYEDIETYIKGIKNNHVVVESQIIALEPSSLYNYTHNYHIRAYVKYRITADTVNVKDDLELIFSALNTYLVGVKNGEWTYGYYDVLMVGTSYSGQSDRNFGVDPWAGISDWGFKGSK